MGKGSNTGKYALGAVAAGVAGYVAGILTAPKSGKETRQDIHRAAMRTKLEAEKKLKALHSELDDLLGEAKKHARNFSTKAKEEWDKAVEVATKAKQTARDVLSAVHEGDADDKDLQKAVEEATSAVKHLKSFMANHVPAKTK